MEAILSTCFTLLGCILMSWALSQGPWPEFWSRVGISTTILVLLGIGQAFAALAVQ